MQYQLRDDTGVKFTLKGADARGNDVDLGAATVTATVSDPKILTATYDATSSTLTVEPVGPLGTAQVALTTTLTDGTSISGELDVTVVGGTPVNFNFDNAATFTIPAPNAGT